MQTPNIDQIVSEWAVVTIDRLQKSLNSKGVGKTGSLYYSFLYQLKGISAAGPSGVQLEFNFYGKFVDMGVGRGYKIEDVNANRDAYSNNARRPKKWLSKTLYGEVLALREILGQSYADQGAQIIRDTIETR